MKLTLAVLVLLCSLAAFCQLPADPQPGAMVKLQNGELIRYYKSGGRARYGLYRALIIIKSDFSATFKTPQATRNLRLTAGQATALRQALSSFDYAAMTSKRLHGPPPSAADGADLWLSLRTAAKTYYWTNTAWLRPRNAPILEFLDGIEHAAPK